jgi:hypothetical protein
MQTVQTIIFPARARITVMMHVRTYVPHVPAYEEKNTWHGGAGHARPRTLILTTNSNFNSNAKSYESA